MTLVTLVLTGILYPLLVTGLAQIIFPGRANGSLVRADGNPVRTDQDQAVGSELIGQAFASPAYFQPRFSCAGTGSGYDGSASGGSNFGPTSAKLRDRLTTATLALRDANPGAPGPVPAELVMASASGLDPHLSPEAALWQVPRIAQARDVEPERIQSIVESHIERRDLGFLGEPRVNVLLLNLALDHKLGKVR
jgi:K+-transporting ATPase ATPase C chain